MYYLNCGYVAGIIAEPLNVGHVAEGSFAQPTKLNDFLAFPLKPDYHAKANRTEKVPYDKDQ